MEQNHLLELSDFDISSDRGFLPIEDPLSFLPPGWEFLDDFGNNLPELIESGRILTNAKLLPVPPAEYFLRLNKRQLQLAWVRYAFIQSAYVHMQTAAPFSICQNIAKPMWAISQMLNKPPILSYDAYTLNNWKRKDQNRGIKVDNLELIQTFMRHSECPEQAWFILIHVDIENQAGLAMRNIREAVLAAERGDKISLESALLNIDVSLGRVFSVMQRMTEGTSPDTYHKIRRWIMSFKDVIYEGVPELKGQPQKLLNGQTGAQSSIFQSIEAGLETPPLEINELATFLKKMREYMPHRHREFISNLEARSQVRKFVISSATHLAEVYNNCISKICNFLDIHFSYAFSYIHNQTDNPRGTGDSEFMKYLKGRLYERRENAYIRV